MVHPSNPIVRTKSGEVEGLRENGISVFRGIPYAAPPVGEKRWLSPAPVKPWNGIRLAHSFGANAPQNRVDPSKLPPPVSNILSLLQSPEPQPQDEDCLFLNVWTPGLDDARRPVMVWIHGGAFSTGAGSWQPYNGAKLARRGNAVIVTINYRLGPLGFLRLVEVTGGRIPATGNEGLLDQIAALEWVRENIRAFGGDPNNVTLFGESAGGMSIGVLLAMPKAKGLFRRVILQSGAAHTIHRPKQSNAFAKRVLAALEIGTDSAERLRSVPTEQLLAASVKATPVGAIPDPEIGSMPFQPVIEGKQVPLHPIDAIRAGSADGVTILVGSNLEEWKLMAPMDPTLPYLDEAGLTTRLRAMMPGVDVDELIKTYRRARTGRGEPTRPGDLSTAIQTDRIYRIAAIRLAESHGVRGNPSYNYLFTWHSPMLGGLLGSCHGLEIGFVFGTTSVSEVFCGAGPEVDALAEGMQDAWLAFARSGDPSCKSLGKWLAYGKNRATMVLGRDRGVSTALFEEERLAYERIPDALIGSI